ncbi:uncharacterized protein MYCFIDRAFT_193570 [Pseudocercospora fijiensis CIRAD86]|uniref:Uncharacterized protein n=1 Tax=Pseudocercospora fijiensis (strain CIRAD86) TaxID=383855 RepID=N1QD41_PSEFD|nr:uncharacterized protein MYCFIDRAFT_193570 [Pseudocercospora fijiensis CIRAD86]EME89723.1 hypothetical protein MYCFIDRAFT_193570 [Pseudocercospora fijiensis CIRAD86]
MAAAAKSRVTRVVQASEPWGITLHRESAHRDDNDSNVLREDAEGGCTMGGAAQVQAQEPGTALALLPPPLLLAAGKGDAEELSTERQIVFRLRSLARLTRPHGLYSNTNMAWPHETAMFMVIDAKHNLYDHLLPFASSSETRARSSRRHVASPIGKLGVLPRHDEKDGIHHHELHRYSRAQTAPKELLQRVLTPDEYK